MSSYFPLSMRHDLASSWWESWSLIKPLMRLKHQVPGLTITHCWSPGITMHNIAEWVNFHFWCPVQGWLCRSLTPVPDFKLNLNHNETKISSKSSLTCTTCQVMMFQAGCHLSLLSASPASVIIRAGAGAQSVSSSAQANTRHGHIVLWNIDKICE